jgi:hypothetical protein
MNRIFACLFLVALVSGSCTHKYFHDDSWVYFEDWDANSDSKLDSAEFISGYMRDDLYKDGKAGKDDKVSAEATAKVDFLNCDENKDGFVGSLEFYHWELNRNPEPKRDTVA